MSATFSTGSPGFVSVFRLSHGSMNFGSTLGGTWGRQREPQIIMKTDERNVILELERKGN
jgi:hypothetical protein